jgi:hypothetical protein
LDLDTPPAFLEMSEQVHLVNGQLRPKLSRPQGCAEKRDHGPPPRLHQQVAIVVDVRNPDVLMLVELDGFANGRILVLPAEERSLGSVSDVTRPTGGLLARFLSGWV